MFIEILNKRKPEFEDLKRKFPIKDPKSKSKYLEYLSKEIFVAEQKETIDIHIARTDKNQRYGFYGEWDS